MPVSVAAMAASVYASVEAGSPGGTRVAACLLGGLAVSRRGLLEEEAWALTVRMQNTDFAILARLPREEATEPQRLEFNRVLRALRCLLLGVRGKGGRSGWEGGAIDSQDFGEETALLLSHRAFVDAAVQRYLCGGAQGRTGQGRAAETLVHEGLADVYTDGIVALQVDELGLGQERWIAAHSVTDHDARCLSEVCFHTIRGGSFGSGCGIERAVDVLTSLRIIELRFMLRLLPEMMHDFAAAKRRTAVEYHFQLLQTDDGDTEDFREEEKEENVEVGEVLGSGRWGGKTQSLRPRDIDYEMVWKKLSEFESFVQMSSADLLARPSNTLQAAANLPSDLAPAVTATAIVAAGKERRPWLKLRNPEPASKHALALNTGTGLRDLSVSRDGCWAAVLAVHGSVTVYDLLRGAHVVTFCEDSRRVVTCVALCPRSVRKEGEDGRDAGMTQKVVCGAESGSVTFWTLVSTSGSGPGKIQAKRGPSLPLHAASSLDQSHAIGGGGKGVQPLSYVHRLARMRMPLACTHACSYIAQMHSCACTDRHRFTAQAGTVARRPLGCHSWAGPHPSRRLDGFAGMPVSVCLCVCVCVFLCVCVSAHTFVSIDMFRCVARANAHTHT